MPEVIQQIYRQYLQEGWPGMNARPNVPCKYMSMKAYVPSGGRTLRPGDAVYYRPSDNTVAVPTSDEQVRQTFGIVSWDVGTVGSTLDSPPAGANSDAFVEIKNGDYALIATFGVFYGTAGAAMEYGDELVFNRGDYDWEKATAPSIAALGTSGDLPDLTDAVADAATPAQVRTFTQELRGVLATWKTALEAFGDSATAYPGNIPNVVFTCDNEEDVASGGLVKINIGVRG